MASNNFKKSLAFVLIDEGGNDDDPTDHGGRTSRGVTQKEYDAWRSEQLLPSKDVWTASESDIEEIYHDEYWNPYCDNFPSGIDYLYFDMAVNAGPHRAAILLQRSLGLTQDGRIGPITREAVAAADPFRLVHDYTDIKKHYYYAIVEAEPDQKRFLHGWLNRCDHVLKNALTMI